MRRTTRLTVELTYDDQLTDPESLASAMDILIETALCDKGILDDYGDTLVGPFYPEGLPVLPES